ncbi:MAG: patatin-like phospholipase family protein [Lysobacterales bacterium]
MDQSDAVAPQAPPEATQQDEKPAVALVLKGGGVKGLALAGAIKELEKHFKFTCYYGTSAGAIAVALLAAGYSGAELADCLYQKPFKEFLDHGVVRKALTFLRTGGLNSGEPVRTWVREMIRARIPLLGKIRMRTLPARAVIYASNESEGTLEFDSSGVNRDASVDFAVRCSMSLPYIFSPVEHDGEFVVDGGLLNNFPLNQFLKSQSGSFVGLYLHSPKGGPSRSRSPLLRLIRILLGRDEVATVDEHADRIVVIDVSPIGTAQFSLGTPEKDFLLSEGSAAALRFMHRHYPLRVSSADVHAAAETATTLRAEVVRRARRRSAARAVIALLTIVAGIAGSVVAYRSWSVIAQQAHALAPWLVPAPCAVLSREGTDAYAREDWATATERFEQAAACGETVASMWLARGYHRGLMSLGRDEDRGTRLASSVIDELEARARAGEPEAQFLVGSAYVDGLYFGVDRNRGDQLIRLAAEQGYPLAQWRFGLEKGDDASIEAAAHAGVVAAARHLGLAHVGRQSPEEALKWFEVAAAHGYQPAALLIGNLVMDNLGTLGDACTACQWYRRGASANIAGAQANLGLCFENGVTCRAGDATFARNTCTAIDWYRKAAQTGNVTGLYNLGVSLRARSCSLPQDDIQKGDYYIEQAALQGYSPAIDARRSVDQNPDASLRPARQDTVPQ